MNYFKTAVPLAVLIALFMLIGFLIGGQIGMIIAFGAAFLMNRFSYWKSYQVVLRMNNEADRLGAENCGQPLWLASALDRVQEVAQNTPNQTAEREPAAAHMFIINPLTGQSMDKLFSTHPRTENRISRLVTLAEEWATYDTPTDQRHTATRGQVTPHPAGPPTNNPWSRSTKDDTRGRGGNYSW